ncbi:MAG: S-methyl-5'-thioinosine phosphorylase [Proteobacteria bacterium]|nr:S-methyl-5'-thioinosine phosphorylase [Pseudomonadota bacterium]
MKLGIIGGSGLYDLPGLADVNHVKVITAWGAPSAALTRGRLHGVDLVFLPRHGSNHHLPPHLINYRANVAALADAGVTAIIATAAVGGIEHAAGTGVIVVPEQVVDYTYGREHTYSDGSQPHPQHVDFSDPYTPRLRADLLSAAGDAGIAVRASGVYAATQGPRLESAAEIDRLERDGCTIVGMTGMPEAALARELGIDYANISLVVNPAAGRAKGEITMADIERELGLGMGRIRGVIAALAARLGKA